MKTDRTELAKLAFMGLTKRERAELLRTFTDTPTAPAPAAPGPDQLLRRATVAAMLAHSPRWVDRAAADGILRRVRLPGHTRASGFRLRDVQALITGGV